MNKQLEPGQRQCAKTWLHRVVRPQRLRDLLATVHRQLDGRAPPALARRTAQISAMRPIQYPKLASTHTHTRTRPQYSLFLGGSRLKLERLSLRDSSAARICRELLPLDQTFPMAENTHLLEEWANLALPSDRLLSQIAALGPLARSIIIWPLVGVRGQKA